MLQAAIDAHLHHVVWIDAEIAHGIEIGEFDTVDPFHGQHAPTGGLVVDGWYGDAGVGGMQFGEAFGIGGFIEIIHLFKHTAAQFINQPYQIAADNPHSAIQPGGDVAHDVEIKGDLLPQARSLHLDGHLLSVGQDAPMYLAEGGR